MAEFPTYEEMAKNVAEKALDDFLYNGKSIREWIQIIASEDCISREYILSKAHCCCDDLADDEPCCVDVDDIKNAPGVQPKLIECEDCISKAFLIDRLLEKVKTKRSTIEIMDKLIPLIKGLPPATSKEPKITDKTIQAILDFLENNNSEWGQIEWKDKNGKGFITDQGYFIEGLEKLRDYLKESEDKG